MHVESAFAPAMSKLHVGDLHVTESRELPQDVVPQRLCQQHVAGDALLPQAAGKRGQTTQLGGVVVVRDLLTRALRQPAVGQLCPTPRFFSMVARVVCGLMQQTPRGNGGGYAWLPDACCSTPESSRIHVCGTAVANGAAHATEGQRCTDQRAPPVILARTTCPTNRSWTTGLPPGPGASRKRWRDEAVPTPAPGRQAAQADLHPAAFLALHGSACRIPPKRGHPEGGCVENSLTLT